MRLLMVLTLSLALPIPTAAQRVVKPPSIRLADTVRSQTVVYLYDGRWYNGLTREERQTRGRLVDSVAAVVRSVAQAEGFRFELRSSGVIRLVDSLGQTLFTPRPDLVTGIVLVAPGRDPQWIPGLPTASQLADILRDYAAGRYRLFTQPARAGAA